MRRDIPGRRVQCLHLMQARPCSAQLQHVQDVIEAKATVLVSVSYVYKER